MTTLDLKVTPPSLKRRGSGRGGWPFIIVPAIVAATLVLYPVIYNVWISLHVNRLSANDGQFAGFDNYAQLFRFGNLGPVLGTTFLWTAACLVFQFLIGFVLALALDRDTRSAGVIRALLISPWVMPGVVVGSIWIAILNPISGLANALLHGVGLPGHDWLGDPSTALGSLVLANVWKGAPFWMLMISAGLKAIPVEQYEASKLDGASYIQRVRYVILPELQEVLILTGLLAFIWTFNYFDLAYSMTHGGPGTSTTTVPFAIYQTSFGFARFDQGAAWSVISFVLMAILIVFYIRLTRRGRTA